MVVTHDYHADVSAQVVAESTALLIYKTCPHVDQRHIGLQAAHLMSQIVRGEVRPTQAVAKPPMLLNIRFHNTSLPPMKPIMDAARMLEQDQKALAASVATGYQYADVAEMGPCAVVITDNDPARSATTRGHALEHA
jgi:microcystin degradation protein MlrC